MRYSSSSCGSSAPSARLCATAGRALTRCRRAFCRSLTARSGSTTSRLLSSVRPSAKSSSRSWQNSVERHIPRNGKYSDYQAGIWLYLQFVCSKQKESDIGHQLAIQVQHKILASLLWGKRKVPSTQEQISFTKTHILIFGAIGGCCPTIAKLASYFSTHWGAPMPEIGVFFAMILFAILGAIISVTVGARDLKTALIAGIVAPGILTNIISGQEIGNQSRTPERSELSNTRLSSLYFLGIGTAIAQPLVKDKHNNPPNLPNSPNSPKLCISIQSILMGLKFIGPITNLRNHELQAVVNVIRYEDENEKKIGWVSLAGDYKNFEIAPSTKMISVLGKSFNVKNLKGVKIIAKAIPYRDFYWVLGGKRKYKIGDVKVMPQFISAKNISGAIEDVGNRCKDDGKQN